MLTHLNTLVDYFPWLPSLVVVMVAVSLWLSATQIV